MAVGVNVEGGRESAFELLDILFISFGFGGDFRANMFFKILPQEVRWVYVDEETEIDNICLVLVPGVGCCACVVMFKEILDFAVSTNLSKRNA